MNDKVKVSDIRPVDFSVVYHPNFQEEFNHNLVSGKLDDAFDVLQNLPGAYSDADFIRRSTVLAEGYRGIVETVLDTCDSLDIYRANSELMNF